MKFFIFLMFCVCPLFGYSQTILPGTAYCSKGSEAHPVTYCTDSTPCRDVGGKKVCLAGTSPLPPGAVTVASSCWSTATDYTCYQYQDGCKTYSSDSMCTEVGARACTIGDNGQPMLAVNPKTGQCSSYTRNFSCVDPRKDNSSSYTQTTDCDTNGLQNGLNWATNSPSSADDFVLAVRDGLLNGNESYKKFIVSANKKVKAQSLITEITKARDTIVYDQTNNLICLYENQMMKELFVYTENIVDN